MKNPLLIITALLFLATVIFLLFDYAPNYGPPPDTTTDPSPVPTHNPSSPSSPQILQANLNIPWDIAFLPDGSYLITQRSGELLYLQNGQSQSIAISGVNHTGEGGLLGLTLHPDFNSNRYLYLYLTSTQAGQTVNLVRRYRFDNNQLSEPTVILDGIAGSVNHDGGRLRFGPDRLLYITTGDAGNENSSQDLGSLNGKILRLNDDGSIPDDNPFNSPVYAFGLRNPQGLAWDDQDRLWATDHGRSGLSSGYDELNLIEPGKNYGWPIIQGSEAREGMVTPVIHSGPSTTWAPSGAAYFNGNIYFAGLRGASLYQYSLSNQTLTPHLENHYGRLRTVTLGPDENLYLLTSNHDGRGNPTPEDDRLIQIQPAD